MNVIANIFKAIFSFYLSFGIIGASFSILYLILDGISSSFFGANFNEFELHKPLLVIYLIAGLYLGFKMCSSIYHYSIIGFLKKDDAKYEQSLKENEIKAIEISTKQLKEKAAALEKKQKEEDYLNELKSKAEAKKKEAEIKLAETISKIELAELEHTRKEELAVNELKRLRESAALKLKETQMKSALLTKDLALKKSKEIKDIDNITSVQDEYFHYCKKCKMGTIHTVAESKKEESSWFALIGGFGVGDDIVTLAVTLIITTILIISLVGIIYLLYKLFSKRKPDYELNCLECGAFHSSFNKNIKVINE